MQQMDSLTNCFETETGLNGKQVKSAPVKIIEELKLSSKYSYVLYQ